VTVTSGSKGLTRRKSRLLVQLFSCGCLSGHLPQWLVMVDATIPYDLLLASLLDLRVTQDYLRCGSCEGRTNAVINTLVSRVSRATPVQEQGNTMPWPMQAANFYLLCLLVQQELLPASGWQYRVRRTIVNGRPADQGHGTPPPMWESSEVRERI
jgi:hypothetical protein